MLVSMSCSNPLFPLSFLSLTTTDTLPVSVLEVPITHLDRRVGLCLGSTDEVNTVRRLYIQCVVVALIPVLLFSSQQTSDTSSLHITLANIFPSDMFLRSILVCHFDTPFLPHLYTHPHPRTPTTAVPSS